MIRVICSPFLANLNLRYYFLDEEKGIRLVGTLEAVGAIIPMIVHSFFRFPMER